MAGAIYQVFEAAMLERKQVVCAYGAFRRQLCPIVLGHSRGEEKALTFQVGGENKSGLPPGGEWRCSFPSKATHAALQNGPWKAGDSHSQPQGCVESVDLDVNPDSPYNPKRRTP